MTGLESSGWRKTGLAQQRMLRIIMHRQIQRVELICRVLICSLRKQPSFFAPGPSGTRNATRAGSEEGRLFSQPICHVICWVLYRFRWGKMASKVHLAFFLLFACCVTVPPLKIICKAKMVRNSAQTVLRILTRRDEKC